MNLKKKSKTKRDILVFSIALQGYSSLFSNCIKTQRNYCSRFGYDYILVDRSPRPLLPAEAAWLKIFFLKEALKCKYKWIAFIDADCEVKGHAPSFVEELEKYGEQKKIFMSHGFSGRINSGVIFLKNSKGAMEYLERVIQNGDNEVGREDEAPYENGHMIKYGKNNPHVQIIDAVQWNNNFTLDHSSYIQHYSGGILREKYLQERPFTKSKYLFMRRIRNKIRILFSTNTTTSMAEIHSLLPFYLKRYPGLGCGK